MKERFVVVAVVLSCLLGLSGCMSGSDTYNDQTQGAEPDTLALSKQDIIDMSRARLSDDVIIKMIRTTDSYFRLRSRDVVALADSGVSDKVIEAMINTSQATERRGVRYYHPPYWWGPYPYYYPWSFGVSVGYYAPLYGRSYYTPYPYYRGGYYYGGGHLSGGGAGSGGSRTSGQRR
ncbi:MAG: hypothetical protein H6Q30_548 [Bacteroidetes bacterium]|jgi:hypothetical protein|nr:hypothetical protein [Bacteroidota bacterium]